MPARGAAADLATYNRRDRRRRVEMPTSRFVEADSGAPAPRRRAWRSAGRGRSGPFDSWVLPAGRGKGAAVVLRADEEETYRFPGADLDQLVVACSHVDNFVGDVENRFKPAARRLGCNTLVEGTRLRWAQRLSRSAPSRPGTN